MIRSIKGFLLSVVLLAACNVFATGPAVTGTPATVALSYSVPESLSLTLSTSTMTLTQVPAYQSFTVTITYNLAQARYIAATAYLSSASAALSSGTNSIPSSAIMEYNSLSTTPMACTSGPWAPVPGTTAGATCQPLAGGTQTPAGSGTLVGTENIALAAGVYPAGNFTGTLNIGVAAQ